MVYDPDFANDVYFLKEAIELEVAYQQLCAAAGIWHATVEGDLALRKTYADNPRLFHNVCGDLIGWSPVSDDHLYDYRDIVDNYYMLDMYRDEKFERDLDMHYAYEDRIDDRMDY